MESATAMKSVCPKPRSIDDAAPMSTDQRMTADVQSRNQHRSRRDFVSTKDRQLSDGVMSATSSSSPPVVPSGDGGAEPSPSSSGVGHRPPRPMLSSRSLLRIGILRNRCVDGNNRRKEDVVMPLSSASIGPVDAAAARQRSTKIKKKISKRASSYGDFFRRNGGSAIVGDGATSPTRPLPASSMAAAAMSANLKLSNPFSSASSFPPPLIDAEAAAAAAFQAAKGAAGPNVEGVASNRKSRSSHKRILCCTALRRSFKHATATDSDSGKEAQLNRLSRKHRASSSFYGAVQYNKHRQGENNANNQESSILETASINGGGPGAGAAIVDAVALDDELRNFEKQLLNAVNSQKRPTRYLMNDWEIGGTQNRWVCPSDRHLQLRAQLKSGWSVRTASARSPTNAKQSTASASGLGVSGGAAGGPSASSSSTLNGGLSEAEQEHIRKVLERAENGRQNEELRIGKMVDRLDKLRSRATGNGVTQCLLCQTEFGLLASKSYAAMCLNCRKYVCQKNCGVETFDQKRGEPIFLCKICSEYREVMWKKSGAWFYREMPNFTRPSMFDGGSSNNNDALCNGGGGALPSPSAFGGAFPYSGSANRRYTPTAADSPCSSAGGSPTASHVPSLRTVRGGGIFSYGGAVNVGMGGDAATIHRSGSRGGGIPDVSSPSRSGANSRSGRGGCDGFGDTFPQAFFPLCNASQQQQQQHQRRSGSGSGSQRGSGGSVGTPTTSMPTGHFIQHQQSGSRQLPIPPDHQQRLKTTPRPRITPSWVHEKVQSSISVGSDCEEDDEEEEDEDDEDAIDDIDELDEFGDADEMDTNNGGSTGRQGGRAATATTSGSATQLSGGGSCAIRAAPSPSSSSSSMSRTAEFPLKQGGGGPTTTSNLSAQNVSGQNQAHSQYSSPHQSNNNQRFQQMTLHEGVGGSFPHLPGSSSGGTTSLGRGRASGGPSGNHHYHHHHNQQTGTISPNAPHHHHHHRQQQHHRSDHELNRCISCEDDAHHQLSAALTSRSYAGVDGGLRSVRRYTARNRSRITDTEDSENDESRRTTPSTSPRHSVATPSSYGGEDVVSSSSQQISSAAVSDQLSSSGGATTPGHVIGGGGGASAGSIIAATLTNDAASDSKSIDSGVVQSDHSVHQTSQGFVSSVDQQQTAMIPIASATTPSNVASNYPSHHQSRLATTVNNAMPYYTTAPPPPIPPRSATVGMPPHPRSAIAAATGVATFASSNDRRHSVAPTPSAARPSSVSPSPTNHSLLLSNPYSNNNNSNNNANNKYNGQRSRLDVSSHESLQSLGTGRKFLQHNADGGTPSTSSTMRQDSESTRRTSGAGSASMSSRRESAHSSSDFLVASMSGECHESAVINCANALKDDEVEEEPSFMSSPDDNDDPNVRKDSTATIRCKPPLPLPLHSTQKSAADSDERRVRSPIFKTLSCQYPMNSTMRNERNGRVIGGILLGLLNNGTSGSDQTTASNEASKTKAQNPPKNSKGRRGRSAVPRDGGRRNDSVTLSALIEQAATITNASMTATAAVTGIGAAERNDMGLSAFVGISAREIAQQYFTPSAKNTKRHQSHQSVVGNVMAYFQSPISGRPQLSPADGSTSFGGGPMRLSAPPPLSSSMRRSPSPQPNVPPMPNSPFAGCGGSPRCGSNWNNVGGSGGRANSDGNFRLSAASPSNDIAASIAVPLSSALRFPIFDENGDSTNLSLSGVNWRAAGLSTSDDNCNRNQLNRPMLIKPALSIESDEGEIRRVDDFDEFVEAFTPRRMVSSASALSVTPIGDSIGADDSISQPSSCGCTSCSGASMSPARTVGSDSELDFRASSSPKNCSRRRVRSDGSQLASEHQRRRSRERMVDECGDDGRMLSASAESVSAAALAAIAATSLAAEKRTASDENELEAEERTPRNNVVNIANTAASNCLKPNAFLDSLGSIQFNLTYLPEEQQLVVHLIRAKNLKAMDKNGFSDPYVKLHLIPGNAKATKLTSKTIEKTLNPEWHEELIYYGVTEDERQRKSLRFTVLDRDRIGSDFLGETRVALKRLPSGSTKKFHLYLEHAMPIPAEKSEELERGKILVSICYNIQQASLFVNIKRCAELLGMDSTGFSDPYCKVSLTPLASKAHRQKTSIKKRTLNPEFKSVLQFIVPFKDLPKKTLEIGVYDYDVGRHDDYIGGILLSTTAKDLRGKQWRDCIQNPGKTFEYWHRLELDT